MSSIEVSEILEGFEIAALGTLLRLWAHSALAHYEKFQSIYKRTKPSNVLGDNG